MSIIDLPAIATSAPPPAPIEQPADNPRRITRRIRAACDALVNGDVRTVTDAAKLANLSRSHLSRELSKPHIAAYLRQKACRALAIAAARASAVKVELLDGASEHVRNDAASWVLGLAGIKPTADAQVSVNIELKAGWVIDISDDRRPDRAVTVDGALPMIDAKPLKSQE